ncbi:MAG TPA: hypothetical protein DD658_09425 [Deltaproteobacteria bacterium]|nr:hypothetical protein [Deltaproteobacteria bacterium]
MSAFAAFATSLGLTQKKAPNLPFPAETPLSATTLTFAFASVSRIVATAPARSRPCARKHPFFRATFSPAFFAAFRKRAAFFGTKSSCTRRPLGNPVKASRSTFAAFRAPRTLAPSPTRFAISAL